MGALLPGPIYAIADLQALAGRPVGPALSTMADAGIRCFQLRAKGASGSHLYRLLEESIKALEGRDCALWLDDRADLAALFPVTGVHVGQRDLPPEAVRRVFEGPVFEGPVFERPTLAQNNRSTSGSESLPAIGQSTHDDQQVAHAADDPEVDVVAVGPIFPTKSKRGAEPTVGLDLLRRARRRTTKPLVAIGGIDASSVPQVLDAGADAIALIGALLNTGGDRDLKQNSRRLVAAAEGRG